MAHVSIGPILGTEQWRAKRDGLAHDCAHEADARAIAKALATGGLQIVETSFPAPTFKAKVIAATAGVMSDAMSAEAWEGDTPLPPPDLTELSVSKLKDALATGDHDDHLEAVDVAERAGRNRASARKAIQARVDAIAGE